MKNRTLIQRVGLVGVAWGACLPAALAALPPAAIDQISVKILGVYGSTSPNCSSPVALYTKADAGYIEASGVPEVFSLPVSAATYSCIIVAMSDQVKARAASTSNNCIAGTEYTTDICNDASRTIDKLDGSTTACSTGAETVYFYLSTYAPSSSAGTVSAFQKPMAQGETKGYPLASALTVTNTGMTKTLVIKNSKNGGLDSSSCRLKTMPTLEVR